MLVWIVVTSKPGQERRARMELENQAAAFGEGFDVYLPLALSMNRKRELVSRPFFPNYLFARVNLDTAAWRRIWSTYGVKGVLGVAERPAALADWVVERIKSQEEQGFIKMGLAAEQAKAMGFTPGQRVRVEGLSLEAVFVEAVDARRAEILLNLIGRDSRVTVDIRKLRSTE